MAETETVEMIHEDELPGHESKLEPKPEWAPFYPGSGRLEGKVALITGADSGIGRAVAALFAREGADIAILYLCEHDDAAETKRIVEAEGRKAITIAGDLGDKEFCLSAVKEVVGEARRDRHPRQQCRRAASRQGHHRHHRGAAEAHLPDQHLLDVLPDPGGAAAPQEGRGDHQLHVGDDVRRLQGAARLQRHQGRDHRLHPLALRKSDRRRDQGERGRAGADLDAAQSVRRLDAGEDEDISARTRRWAAPASPTRSRRASCSSPARTAATCPGRCSIPMAGRSSAARPWRNASYSSSAKRGS